MNTVEMADMLGIKPSYLKSHWNKIKADRATMGLEMMKLGRGDSARYGIRLPGEKEWRWSKVKE